MDAHLEDLLTTQERAVGDFVALVRDLDDADGARETALPGWTVHDVVAHVAHLEAAVAGAPESEVAVPADLEHVRSPMGTYTESGVIARRDRTLASLADEIEESTVRWVAALRADPPEDLGAPARSPFGDIGWSWQVLLGNRPLDVWVHEHDVRVALDRHAFADTPVARHVVSTFARGFGRVVAKRAGAPAGTVAALRLHSPPLEVVVAVGEDGRGSPAPADAEPDVVLRMDLESYVSLAAGRRGITGPVIGAGVEVTGDRDLADRIMESMVVTP